MGKRRKARETAVQIMYQIEIMEQVPYVGVNIYLNNFSVSDAVADYAKELVFGVFENVDDIDATIGKRSKHWKVGRMTSIDRNILRIAVYELMFKTDVPGKACINEAIEIAKKFSSIESSAFINGILDAVLKTKEKAS